MANWLDETVDEDDILYLCDPGCPALRLFRRDFQDAQTLIRKLASQVKRMDCSREDKVEIVRRFNQAVAWIRKAGQEIAAARGRVATARAKAGADEEAEEAVEAEETDGADDLGLPQDFVTPPPPRVAPPPPMKQGNAAVVKDGDRQALEEKAQEQED